MLRTAFKQNIKNPLNLLWLIAPVAWYMGTGATRQNIEFISNAAQTNEAFRQQLTAINGYAVL